MPLSEEWALPPEVGGSVVSLCIIDQQEVFFMETIGRILTMADKANLEKELDELRQAKQDVAEEIKIARGHGDLSENAEYTEAKNNEARIYGRLAEVEELLGK